MRLLIVFIVSTVISLVANSQPNTSATAYTDDIMNFQEWMEYLSKQHIFNYSYNPAMIDGAKKTALKPFTTLSGAFSLLSEAYQVEFVNRPGQNIIVKPAKKKSGMPAQSLLNGKVLDQNSKTPVTGAAVYLKKTNQLATTNKAGDFELFVPYPLLRYELIIAAEGFEIIR